MSANRDQKSKDIASAAVEVLSIAEMFSPVITEATARRAISIGCLAAAKEGLPVRSGLTAATKYVNSVRSQNPNLLPGQIIVQARAMAKQDAGQ